VRAMIAECIDRLASAERDRCSDGVDVHRQDTVLNLSLGLSLFWARIPPEKRDTLIVESRAGVDLLSLLQQHAEQFTDNSEPSFTATLHRETLRRSGVGQADPRWALMVIAESLFRGRSEANPYSSHYLLPKLVNDALALGTDNLEESVLLCSWLSQLQSALDSLAAFARTHKADAFRAVVENAILGVETGENCSERLADLRESINRESEFCEEFSERYHAEVTDIVDRLGTMAQEVKLRWESDLSQVDDDLRVLIPTTHLLHCLHNFAVESATQYCTNDGPQLRIRVTRSSDRVVFEVLTNYSPLDEAQRRFSGSRNSAAHVFGLAAFDGSMMEPHEPSPSERDAGFTTSYVITTPAGFPGG